MKKLKYEIIFIILFMSLGIAVVSSNLVMRGLAPIASNVDDFLVYFSDVLVDGVQDLSLVRSNTELRFFEDFSLIGEKVEITYDVTNASKNYDADIDIKCTDSSDYLTITNSFDDSTVLPSRSTRTGNLVVSLDRSYVGSDLVTDITCEISSVAVEKNISGSNGVPGPLNPFYIGREVVFGDEKFNIIGEDEDTVTLFAQYNIDAVEIVQSVKDSKLTFASGAGWEYTPGPIDIDVRKWGGNSKQLLNYYLEYLQNTLHVENISVDLVSLKQLSDLGCIIPSDYAWVDDSVDRTCETSPYVDWLVNGQFWWTKSVVTDSDMFLWLVNPTGVLSRDRFITSYSIRPTITISKENLLKYLNYKIYAIGEQVDILGEKFNVVSQTAATVTMLAQYNISREYRQTQDIVSSHFSNRNGWEYELTYMDINVQDWADISVDLLNSYVSYFRSELGDDAISGDFITLFQLEKLGCTVPNYYLWNPSSDSRTCVDSPYSEWLINDQRWWTRSVVTGEASYIWGMDNQGVLTSFSFVSSIGVRPLITISKETLQ